MAVFDCNPTLKEGTAFMSSSNLIRWCGMASILGGVMRAAGGVVNLFAPIRAVFDSPSDCIIEVPSASLRPRL